jgi:hypothetical protein
MCLKPFWIIMYKHLQIYLLHEFDHRCHWGQR